jgi:maltooligosyltrehalose trehalohydrolase
MRLFGPTLERDGVLFRIWAPSVRQVSLVLEGRDAQEMAPAADGFFELHVPGAGAGQLYMFETLGRRVPDPASRRQSEDAAGWSVVCPDLAPGRRKRARSWAEAVICEVHVGTATPEGTLRGLRERLPYFAEAGYTALELMPIAEFSGARNWGYDGVQPFAVEHAYGTREDLLALVDAAHEFGLSVMLDVVYNHFGPDGSFLDLYAKPFFNGEHTTPWGAAINFAHPLVRAFFLENVEMWLGEFGVDGLRFDAVHAFNGDGVDQFLSDVAMTAREVDSGSFLVLENDKNEASWLAHGREQAPFFTAQWNDDFHHVFHVLATGECEGYYCDYAEGVIGRAAKVLAEGFAYQGQPSPYRGGASRGQSSAALHPTSFVSFLQNHDQIGNRPLGDRLTARTDPQRLALLNFVLLLSPQIPLLFMGEEIATQTPFPFFCDFQGALADAVREGRKREFAEFVSLSGGYTLPDPLDASTFEMAKLPWDAIESGEANTALTRFRHLTRFRAAHVVPLLETAYRGAELRIADSLIACSWSFEAGSYSLLLNPGDRVCETKLPEGSLRLTVGPVEQNDAAWRFGAWSGAFVAANVFA